MPATRCGVAPTSGPPNGPSAMPGDPRVRSQGRCGLLTYDRSGARPRELPQRFRSCRLAGCTFKKQPKAEGMGQAIGLTVQVPVSCFPWTAAIHPMETVPNGDVTALCRPASGAAAVPASAIARRGLFLPMGGETRPLYCPGGWQQRTLTIPDCPLAGVTHPRRPHSAGQSPHGAAHQPDPAERGRGSSPGLCSRRLEEIEAGPWKVSPEAASLPPGPNQSEPCGLV